MIKKSGKIQMVFTPSKSLQVNKRKAVPSMEYMAAAPEKNRVATFVGIFQMFRKLITAYRSGCDKVYIFFDNLPIK